ncbi:MAG: hypothetical protein N3F66_13110 [Spirochaetes bacterium]|nr:hypothetical protein [Spirochaetota bacterium]
MAKNTITKQYTLTPAAGKRLIAKAIVHIPEIQEALQKRTIVIVSGTTNGYIAEEMLMHIKQIQGFSRERFFRGITLPPRYNVSQSGRLEDGGTFAADVVIEKGKWVKDKSLFEVVNDLQEGDIIFKGANAVNLETKQAAVLIGHPQAGTIGVIMQAVAGKRVLLYIPVGLEKRITANINEMAQIINSPQTKGIRYFPITGIIITELEAIHILTGAQALVFAAGGVSGAEGSVWIAVTGTEEQIKKADEIINSVRYEQNFII